MGGVLLKVSGKDLTSGLHLCAEGLLTGPMSQCQLMDNLGLFHDQVGIFEARVTDGCDLDGTIGTLKNGNTEFFFEFLDLATQG